jgi:hypothetical protein
VMGFFAIGSLELFAQGWLPTAILLIATSWVARIIGISHWCPAVFFHSVSFLISKQVSGQLAPPACPLCDMLGTSHGKINQW